MAGKPRMRAFEKQVEQEGGDAVIFDRIVNGESVQSIMDTYGRSRVFFYEWVKRGGGPRAEAYETAKRTSADHLVEEAMGILDDDMPIVSSAEVSLRSARANFRKWLAGMRSDEYSEKPQIQVNASFGNLHLEALQKLGAVAPTAIAPPENADYEVEDA